MILYFDLDINRFITRPGFVDAVRRVEFKRGDAANVSLVFLRDNNIVELAPGAEIRFGIKEVGRYDDDAIVFFSDWQLVTLAYVGSPNFNTEGINALLFNDGDADNDVAFLDAMLEISYTEDGGLSWNSSDTVSARIHNDVIRGDEGVPLAGDPAYPSAQAFADVVSAAKTYASIAMLEAARPAASQEARSISRVTNDPNFGFMEVVCVDLGNGKQWLPYPKILDDSVRMGWGDFTGFTAGSFADLSSSFLTADIDLSPPTASAVAIEEVKHLFPLANIRISSFVLSSGSSASANVDARITPLNSVQFIAITSASLGGVSRETSSFTLTHDDLMANVRVRATNSPASSSVIFVLNHLAR